MTTERCKKILIKCLPNYRPWFEYTVTVFDSHNQVIYEGVTSEDGMAELQVAACDEYKIRVGSRKPLSPAAICRWLTLCPREDCSLYFIFSPVFCPRHITRATFFLTDRNYQGLPISKGEITLWRAPM